MALHDRETARLRFGRTTEPGAFYFVTACTKNRTPVLTARDNGIRVTAILQAMHTTRDIDLAAASVMPDHVHMLFALGARLAVGQVMGKFKTLARESGKSPWHWQQDGFEHRLRRNESIEDYGFYIFMNPYRAGLCPLAVPWTWWLCPQPSIFRFLESLDTSRTVPRAWLGLNDEIGKKITTGD